MELFLNACLCIIAGGITVTLIVVMGWIVHGLVGDIISW